MVSFSALSLGLALSGTAVPGNSWTSWLNRNVVRKIVVTGSRRVGFHQHDVDGDMDAYTSTNLYGQGGKRFTDFGSVSLTGRSVLGVLNFNMRLSDNRFQDPQAQKMSIDYAKGPITVNLGDIRGSLLNTNRFASFSKTLYGGMAGFRSGRLQVKAVQSESKGSARTVSIVGNNSPGPYYLQSNQLVSGSETVQLDGRTMQLGRDYVINYEIGSITFINEVPRPTSSIVVSYEAYGFNANRGTIQGAGLSYDMGKWGRLGLTNLEQRSSGGGRLSTRLEQFEGFGSAATPYFLQFEPLQSRPITVRVDGQLQVRASGPDGAGDFFFDSQNPAIFYFTRFMPASSDIDVVYTPKPTATVDGSRRVIGVDYRIPLGRTGKNGYIGYSQATGKLLSATPMQGTARGLEGQYEHGPLQLRASVRDVPDGFVSVETRGLNRNEKAVQLSADYQTKNWVYGASHTNSSISIRRTTNDGGIVFSRTRSTESRARAALVRDGQSLLVAEHIRNATGTGTQTSELETTSLSTGRRLGRVETRLGVEHQEGFGPLSGGTRGSIQLDTLKASADWNGGNGLTLGARTSLSAIKAAGESGKGTDFGISGAWSPREEFRIEGSYTISDSGKLATLGGFQNGSGIGYDGNGFSGGVSNGFAPVGRSNMRELALRSRYQMNERMGIDVAYTQSLLSGGYSSNSETSAYSLSTNWDLRRGHRIYASLDQSQTRFVDSPLKSDALSFSAGVEGNPGLWTYRLGANVLLNGGNSSFQQDSVFYDASVSYLIRSNQRVGLSFQSGSTRGYLPQMDEQFALTYEYQLFDNVALLGSYKVRNVRNLDPFVSTGAYRFRGFDLELSFNFAGR